MTKSEKAVAAKGAAKSRKAAHDMTQAEKAAERQRRAEARAAAKAAGTEHDEGEDDSDLEENTTGKVPTAIPPDYSGGVDATVAGEGAGTETNDTGAVYENLPAPDLGTDVNNTGTVETVNPPESTVPGKEVEAVINPIGSGDTGLADQQAQANADQAAAQAQASTDQQAAPQARRRR